MNIDKKILALIDELDNLRKQRDDAWQVPRESAMFLYQVALGMGAQRILEIGTSYGFSGLFWGAALRRTGGRLHTIDRDPKKYDSSKLTFTKAGLNDIITNHLGDAHELLPPLEGPSDIVFIDADKPSTRDYFHLVWPRLRVGGSVLTDNVISHRQQMEPFLNEVRNRADAASIEVPIGSGIEWTVKLND